MNIHNNNALLELYLSGTKHGEEETDVNSKKIR